MRTAFQREREIEREKEKEREREREREGGGREVGGMGRGMCLKNT